MRATFRVELGNYLMDPDTQLEITSDIDGPIFFNFMNLDHLRNQFADTLKIFFSRSLAC